MVSTSTEFRFRPKYQHQLHNWKTPYENVFGTKPRIPLSLKLGLYRNKHKLCCSKFCETLPSHSHSENSLKNELLDNLLQPQLSQALLERERTFKQIYSSTFERCREQTARSHAYRNRFKLGRHLQIRQKVLYENHKQDLTRSQSFKTADMKLLLSPSVLRILPIKFRTIKTPQLSKLFKEITLSNTILKKGLYPQ